VSFGIASMVESTTDNGSANLAAAEQSGWYTAGNVVGIAASIVLAPLAAARVARAGGVLMRETGVTARLARSAIVGRRSTLFANGKYTNGAFGLLNRGPLRFGWGMHNGRDVFRLAVGENPTRWHWDLLP
jgi:hypothetical protein